MSFFARIVLAGLALLTPPTLAALGAILLGRLVWWLAGGEVLPAELVAFGAKAAVVGFFVGAGLALLTLFPWRAWRRPDPRLAYAVRSSDLGKTPGGGRAP